VIKSPLFRIVFLVLIAVSAFIFIPRFFPTLRNSFAFDNRLLDPLVTAFNQIVPDNLQIKKQAVLGDQSTNSTEQVGNDIVQSAKDKISEFSQNQLQSVKKEATTQFCEVIIEKIRSECDKTINNITPSSAAQ
jgi:hypothetical protein